MLTVVFLAFVAVGSYYVWTGPEAPPLGERARLDPDAQPTAIESVDPTATVGVPLAAVREAGRRANRDLPPATAAVDGSRLGVIEILPRIRGASLEGDGEPDEENPGSSISVPPTKGRRVVVAAGDTLTSIARRHLGDGGRWREIHLANRETIGSDPDALRVGMVLVLPADPPR